MMKAIHVITGLGREYGGPVRSVQGLVAALEAEGVETWLLSMKTDARPWLDGVRHFHLAHANGYLSYRNAMTEMIRRVKPDIVHLHNVWNPDSHAAAVVCRKLGVPYVSAPRGSLEPWCLKQKALKKKLALWLYQRKDLECACALHATAESEKEQFRRLGLSLPVVVSPNGVNMPDALPPREVCADGFRRVLFMSRIHRKKGLIDLVEAWGRLRPVGWKCEIVGFDEDGSLEAAMALARKGGYADDFVITGPLSDDRKWEACRRADLFVLPTHSENFGIVIAEALYAGVPVITTTGAPWRDLVTHRCGWWIERSMENLVAALEGAMALSDGERAEMGENGRRLVCEKYSWSAIGAGMKKAYEALLSGKTDWNG